MHDPGGEQAANGGREEVSAHVPDLVARKDFVESSSSFGDRGRTKAGKLEPCRPL